ncbi:MAG TPA: carboxypeptidase regulatory-like domain-containing protein, partial [Gemmatimonadaceae bacterium]|nr:carboxypeptidase regulatory-like domain-containing protein [Gemmatimonadaceae bacterium]
MTNRLFLCRALAVAALFSPLDVAIGATPRPSIARDADRSRANADVTGTVTDSTNGQPLQSAEVSLATATGDVVSNTTTNAFGQFTIHNVSDGTYKLSVHMLGFAAESKPLTIGSSAATHAVNFAMSPVGLNLEAMQVTATSAIAVDTRTGDQVFQQNDYHGAPTNTTSQILQQSIAGAARAPTGEVHIRGQHAEYTYYIDGVPVPPGISGSLNELFDPEVVNQINFQTGGWDAEYGRRNAAIVNVTTKIPSGGFHGFLSSYDGMFQGGTTVGDKGFNGESASASGNSGPW